MGNFKHTEVERLKMNPHIPQVPIKHVAADGQFCFFLSALPQLSYFEENLNVILFQYVSLKDKDSLKNIQNTIVTPKNGSSLKPSTV